MARDPRYDVLFEPVRIGPVTAKNRGILWPMPLQWGTWKERFFAVTGPIRTGSKSTSKRGSLAISPPRLLTCLANCGTGYHPRTPRGSQNRGRR